MARTTAPVGRVQTLTAATPVEARHWALVLCEKQRERRLAGAFGAPDDQAADIINAMTDDVRPNVRPAVRAGCKAGFRIRAR